jgi:ubiquinone/menaquinone biosynthesis C-methylase UbiE
MPIDPRVVEANQKVHAILADQYNEVEPHFRPENQVAVKAKLERIALQAPSRGRMLDLGCGTGFLLNLASDLFAEIEGIDATEEMLNRVDKSLQNVSVRQGLVELLPFDDGSFDLVTAYSFLDHLNDHKDMFREASRVLKPGGKFYVDLVPNQLFWIAIEEASQVEAGPLDQIVEREINELLNHEEKLQSQFGIKPEDWRLAEPAKSTKKGFLAQDLISELNDVGIQASIEYEWFLGQAVVMHNDSFESASAMHRHLKKLLPVSAQLYKYLVIYGTKNAE